jgi:hypothetical protein
MTNALFYKKNEFMNKQLYLLVFGFLFAIFFVQKSVMAFPKAKNPEYILVIEKTSQNILAIKNEKIISISKFDSGSSTLSKSNDKFLIKATIQTTKEDLIKYLRK